MMKKLQHVLYEFMLLYFFVLHIKKKYVWHKKCNDSKKQHSFFNNSECENIISDVLSYS